MNYITYVGISFLKTPVAESQTHRYGYSKYKPPNILRAKNSILRAFKVDEYI